MARERAYSIGQVAEGAGVSVRTLHHYDAIGLLVPSGRSGAGYRLYDEGDLLRLQQILIGRELGLSLEAIRRSLDDPSFDRRGTLLTQRAELEKRALQTQAMLHAIDAALARLDAPMAVTPEGESLMQRLFSGFDPARYAVEAEQRWGETEAYQESSRRTRSYSAADWKRMKDEQNAIYTAALALLRAGKSAADAEARAVAERHRRFIEQWFYPCGYEMHGRLASLYEADPRFAANIDVVGAGLTPFLVSAIRENAGRFGD